MVQLTNAMLTRMAQCVKFLLPTVQMSQIALLAISLRALKINAHHANQENSRTPAWSLRNVTTVLLESSQIQVDLRFVFHAQMVEFKPSQDNQAVTHVTRGHIRRTLSLARTVLLEDILL
jgi:hypothetical protein